MDETAEDFSKVDRALELQVIDWLQFAEFPESLLKTPDDADLAQLTLILIAKRKRYTHELEKKIEELENTNRLLVERLGYIS